MQSSWIHRLIGASLGFALCLACGTAAAQPAKGPPAKDPPAKDQPDVVVADQLFLEATRALKEGKTQVAYEKLTLAWQQKKSMDIAANLALLETQRGEKVQAAQHLDYAVRNFPPTGNAAIKARMQSDLQKLEQQVCRIRVVAPPGTALRIDGRDVEMAYAGGPLYVEPGRRRFDGVHAELGRGDTTIDATPGVETVVKIELIAPKDASSGPVAKAPPIVPPADDAPAAPRPMWPGILGLAVGGAAAGAGAGLIAYSQIQASDAKDRASGLQCNPADLSTECRDVVDTLDSSNTLGNVAIGMFSAGGAALVFGAVWLAIPNPDGKQAVRVTPVVTADNLGLWIDVTL